MSRKPFYGTIPECPRCGKKHANLHAVPFGIAPLMDDQMWSHWAMCPETHEPVMLHKPSRNFTVMWEATGSTYVMRPSD